MWPAVLLASAAVLRVLALADVAVRLLAAFAVLGITAVGCNNDKDKDDDDGASLKIDVDD